MLFLQCLRCSTFVDFLVQIVLSFRLVEESLFLSEACGLVDFVVQGSNLFDEVVEEV
jgi:hypothetical protein